MISQTLAITTVRYGSHVAQLELTHSGLEEPLGPYFVSLIDVPESWGLLEEDEETTQQFSHLALAIDIYSDLVTELLFAAAQASR